MALATALVLILLIIASILGIVFLIGLILLIIGIVRKSNKKNEGKKSPVVLIVTGAVLMVPSIICVVLIAVSLVKSDINRAHWENEADSIVELWQHTSVTDEKAAPQALNALLTAADDGDKEAFMKCFAESVREDDEFEDMVDQFFEEYEEFPDELADLEFDGGVSGGTAEHNRGVSTRVSSAYYDINLGSDSYYIRMRFCFENDKDPDEIGVTLFEVTNLGGNVDYNLTMDGREIDHDDIVACHYCTPDEVSARRIGGHARRWTDTDLELISVDEMRDLLEDCDTIREAWNSGLIGTANSEYQIPQSTAEYYYYEVEPEDGEERYVKITVSSDGRILDAWLCSEDKHSIEKIK